MRTVLITGGSFNIGLALVEAYLAQGWRVINVDKHSPDRVIKGEYHYVHGDLNDIEKLSTVFATAKANTKQIDALIHNAVFNTKTTLKTLDEAVLDESYRVNIKAPLLLTKWFAEQYLGDHGRIIHVTSTRAYMSEKDTLPYTMSKGAMAALTHALAITLADKHITVNAVAPGWIAHDNERLRLIDHRFHPSGRVGTSDDVVRACLYLTEKGNNFVNATTLVVDGGVTKKMIYPE